jgi:hypothetical protein
MEAQRSADVASVGVTFPLRVDTGLVRCRALLEVTHGGTDDRSAVLGGGGEVGDVGFGGERETSTITAANVNMDTSCRSRAAMGISRWKREE